MTLNAALPELSSLEPLEFDEASQRLVARGDARLDFDGTRIRADRITYYQDYSLADANGNVVISRDGGRLLADRLSYDGQESIFSVDLLRTGQWPYYVTGVSAGGSSEDVTIDGATLYYGAPSRFGLSASSDNVHYKKEGTSEYVAMTGATFRVGSVPFFYLPSYRHYLEGSPYLLDLNAGSDSSLGYYLQTTSLLPVTSWLRAGANLDFYSQRGVLAGPTAQYTYSSTTQTIVGALSTGAIHDNGSESDRGVDTFGETIDAERGFAEWRHKHHIGERFTATASISYWSDSEVTRDFRDDIYNDNERPDSFAEAVYAGDNYLISAFGRFKTNDFQTVQERSPEVSFDLLPVPIFNTGAYHRASASYVQLNEDFGNYAPLLTVEGESDRFDLSYRIERPFALTDWLTFKPLAGARFTHYENQQIDPRVYSPAAALIDDNFSRQIYELGFDLEARAYASYPTVNKTWDIDGLRHLVRPVLRYRYYSDPDDLNEIATIDRQVFDLQRPLLDLSDLRNVDEISETHLVRLGVENLFQTRAKGYGSRTLAALNFYQDILFEKDLRYDGDEEDTFNATWVELVLSPAPWLKFDLASRFKTESMSLEELRTRTTLTSGEAWELGLSTDLLNHQIDQYRLDFIYRINERYAFLSDVNFDADTGEFTKVKLGLRTRIGSTWELVYAITFREDAQRESDVEFQLQLRLTGDE
ncbi:LPS assembly protein LptD [Coraliomargarita sp. SDUM461003]|uniref:LPS assembly protein LptD n=1 Tax=Thalassobacterium maritimum TaxID=3041265 RepID=A0ABU1AYX7_9BACT|nr:LPS assembly protein LptD [Coraliomargarita sp. SDUM461003]MDQ8209353.1 LPS assembly protein LptD [Coraliomargarita sp. SDUM461003]